MRFLVNSTPTALWHDIIHEAEEICANPLKQELEAYLVFLMMRYTAKPEIAKQIIAIDFLNGIHLLAPTQRERALQEVGDKCLLFTGLFPRRARTRLVKLSYFVNMGQSSYATLSKTQNDLYSLLSIQFVSLMDILQSIRRTSEKYPDLLPLEAYDLWIETGSNRASAILSSYRAFKPQKQ